MKEIEAVLTVKLTSIIRASDRSAEVAEKNQDEKINRFIEALKQEHGLDDVLVLDKKLLVKDVTEETAADSDQ